MPSLPFPLPQPLKSIDVKPNFSFERTECFNTEHPSLPDGSRVNPVFLVALSALAQKLFALDTFVPSSAQFRTHKKRLLAKEQSSFHYREDKLG